MSDAFDSEEHTWHAFRSTTSSRHSAPTPPSAASTWRSRDGEFMIMVGPSGCGKTTTLNMISGLETPTSGQIIIGNTVVNDLEPGERGPRHGVPGSCTIPAHDGVREHRLRPAHQEGGGGRDSSGACDAAAEAVHIKPLLPKLPRQCSGGESQRVALARTIVTNPGRVSHGRAAIEPRRQAAGRHAGPS